MSLLILGVNGFLPAVGGDLEWSVRRWRWPRDQIANRRSSESRLPRATLGLRRRSPPGSSRSRHHSRMESLTPCPAIRAAKILARSPPANTLRKSCAISFFTFGRARRPAPLPHDRHHRGYFRTMRDLRAATASDGRTGVRQLLLRAICSSPYRATVATVPRCTIWLHRGICRHRRPVWQRTDCTGGRHICRTPARPSDAVPARRSLHPPAIIPGDDDRWGSGAGRRAHAKSEKGNRAGFPQCICRWRSCQDLGGPDRQTRGARDFVRAGGGRDRLDPGGDRHRSPRVAAGGETLRIADSLFDPVAIAALERSCWPRLPPTTSKTR